MYCGVPTAEPIRVRRIAAEQHRLRFGASVLSGVWLQIGPIDLLRQPPIDDQRLAEIAEHDIARLQIAMNDPAAMGIFDRVANVDKSAEQFPQLERSLAGRLRSHVDVVERIDRVFETVAVDEPHRVERPAVGICSQAVDRHDARMLELPGHFRFENESRAAARVVGVSRLNLLEGHLAMEFLVFGDEHFAEAALGMFANHAKSQAG